VSHASVGSAVAKVVATTGEGGGGEEGGGGAKRMKANAVGFSAVSARSKWRGLAEGVTAHPGDFTCEISTWDTGFNSHVT
jgi:hypothetical protein